MKGLLLATLKVLGTPPPAIRAAFGRFLGRIASVVPTLDRSIAEAQLKLAFPGRPELHSVDRVYASLGETLLEALNLSPLLEGDAVTVSTEDWQTAERIIARGKGIVALSAHTGNWELLAAAMVRRGVPLTVIAREARRATLQEALRAVRARSGVGTIWRGNKQGVLEIKQQLAANGIVAALIDQDTRVSGVFVPFFGRPAKTPSTMVEMAKQQGASIVTCFVFRLSPGKYQAFIEEIPTSWDTEAILTEFSRRLEALITRFPEQWAWMHKRWRTQPDGSHPRSAEYLRMLNTMIEQRSRQERNSQKRNSQEAQS